MGEAPVFSVVANNLGFTEGPVFRSNGDIVATTIDRGHLYLVGPEGASLLAVTGGGANGATEGPEGVLYVAQNGGRGPGWRRPALPGGIQAVRPDGSVEWITQDPVSPNDLCFGPDGTLWVTDPTHPLTKTDGRLWKVDVVRHEAELVMSVPWFANGLAFGPEEDALYVVSTTDSTIFRFPVESGGLGAGEEFARVADGRPDGIAFDIEGNLLVGVNGLPGSTGDVQVLDSGGKVVERMRPADGRYFTNLALDSVGRLAVTHPDTGSVLLADWPVPGLPLYPFRDA